MTTSSTPLYCLIPLTKGLFTKVSPHRLDELNQFKWHAHWNPQAKKFYAVRSGRKGEPHHVRMHRIILGLPQGDPRVGDHVNLDTLDNTDENLRILSMSHNTFNSGKRSTNTSGFKGVSRQKKRWLAQIHINGKNVRLGLRDTPEEAHELYRQSATKHYPGIARTE